MTIAGFQPLSLLDYPGVVASIIFTQGCVLRCLYCHNPELIPLKPQVSGLTQESILAQLTKYRRMIEGVCVTGGEPTIHPDLPNFLKKLKALGLLIKLDTNGVHSRLLRGIINQGLVDYIAMDIKHTWERYPDIIGLHHPRLIAECQKTLALIQSSSVTHEFRTTVYPALHQAEDLTTIAKQLTPGTRYALQGIRYETTLIKNLPRTPSLDLAQAAAKIRQIRPDLHIEIRT